MKNKLFVFIFGIITGVLFIGFCVGSAILGYSGGNYLIDKLESLTKNKEDDIHQSLPIPSYLNLSFESPDDLKIFHQQESGMEISDKFATDGTHSLLVEFPGGREAPAILFDILGNKCLNWEKMQSFSFDVLNSTEKGVDLLVRIKSGEQYPKRVYMQGFNLSSFSPSRVIINKRTLEDKLDLDKISYIGFVILDPSTTFKLYFDNLRVNTNEPSDS